MLALVDAETVYGFVVAAAGAYERVTGIRPEIDPVRPVAGAGLMPGA